jgi:2'-5' RNA ligase
MATAELGVPRNSEDRPYSPHLTLARAGGRSGSPKWRKGDGPNTIFATLEKRLNAMGKLDFGTMTAREFILYQSQLSPGGSKYTKLQRFPLRALSPG